jgi:ribosomal protein S18 acetylase RimI-like enzyme
MSASKQMAEKHTALLSMPHYYLSVLGLRPEAQGKGLATQLITPMLERADSEAKPCYLDTHNEANVNLYRHYGFDVVDQDAMKGLSVKHWVMIRSPR